MASKHVFITGATGCVGHYLLRDLLRNTDFRLTIVARDFTRLRISAVDPNRLRVIEADLTDFKAYSAAIDSADAAILLAASWGGPDTQEVNCNIPLRISERLARSPDRQIIYFSTASVLDRKGMLLPEAGKFGSEYIRSKFEFVQAVEHLSTKLDIRGLFPTLVVGGDDFAPNSHFARLLQEASRWVGLARFLRVDARFHFIHAQDIAAIVRFTLLDEARCPHATRVVLGTPAVTIDECVQLFARVRGKLYLPILSVGSNFAEILIRLFKIELSDWDRYCMLHRDQSYDAPTDPTTYNQKSVCPDFFSVLRSLGLAHV